MTSLAKESLSKKRAKTKEYSIFHAEGCLTTYAILQDIYPEKITLDNLPRKITISRGMDKAEINVAWGDVSDDGTRIFCTGSYLGLGQDFWYELDE